MELVDGSPEVGRLLDDTVKLPDELPVESVLQGQPLEAGAVGLVDEVPDGNVLIG